MGILRLALGEGTTMKLFVFACLVAMALADAEPKADADPYYGYYGLGYHGLGYGLGYRGYGYGYGLGHHYGYYGKRSAEAEPTAAAEAWATMVLDTVPTDTVSDTTDTPVLATTDTVLDTTARGPLRPSPPLPLMLMLRLIPTTATTAMDTDTVLDTTVLDTAPTDTVLATTATATVCTDTTDKCPADSRQLRNYIKFK